MNIKHFLIVLGTLFLISSFAYADARLEKTLGLDTNQARQVQQIQKKYRREFSSKRQELNRELRKLRRARIANDSRTMAQQERITAKLEEELRQIRTRENDQIRRVLSSAQRAQFEDVIQQRRAAVGSSRDARIFNF